MNRTMVFPKVFSLMAYILANVCLLSCLTACADQTTHIGLKELMAGVASPDIVINENSWKLDALVFPLLAAYPASVTPEANNPGEGDLFIVPANPVGAWAGHQNDLALRINDQWKFIEPVANIQVITDSGLTVGGMVLTFDGSTWTAFSFHKTSVFTDQGETHNQIVEFIDYENTLYGAAAITNPTRELRARWGLYQDNAIFQLIQGSPFDVRVNLQAGSSGFIQDNMGFGGITDPEESIHSFGQIRTDAEFNAHGITGYTGVIPSSSNLVVSGGIIIGVTD